MILWYFHLYRQKLLFFLSSENEICTFVNNKHYPYDVFYKRNI